MVTKTRTKNLNTGALSRRLKIPISDNIPTEYLWALKRLMPGESITYRNYATFTAPKTHAAYVKFKRQVVQALNFRA